MYLFRSCHLPTLWKFIWTTFLLAFTLTVGYTLTRTFDYDSVVECIQNFWRPTTFLNITNFRFTENPKHLCSKAFPESAGRKTIINVVHSARANFLRREIIRRTHGAVKIFKSWYIQTVFTLGQPSPEDDDIEYLLENEVKKHGDIIQGSFLDSFRNLSIKALVSYKWSVEFCPQANFYIKSDDDVVIDIFLAIKFLSSNKSEMMDRNYYCAVHPGMAPMREDSSPYKVTKEEFPGDVYPDFCSFGVFLTGMGTVKRILGASKKPFSFLHLEEVFVSGILRQLSNKEQVGAGNNTIGFINVPSGFFEKEDKIEDVVKKGYLGVIPVNKSPNTACLLWNSILQQHNLTKFYVSTCLSLF